MYSFSLKPACLSVARAFRVWRLARCLSRPGIGGNGVPLYAGAALGLLLVCQINAPSLHRAEAMPCREMAGLAACVVMGPKPVKTGVGKNQGFTLIEISIVLVIIGLVVGGVLVGQDLINAAGVRSQISQIDKYNAAVHAFQLKYNALPGDMNATTAAAYGFAPRGNYWGQGDGNGVLEGTIGNYNGGGYNFGLWETGGETVMFWSDLTYANGLNLNLIEGGFSAASPNTPVAAITGPVLDAYFPRAMLGNGNYIIAYSWNGINYFSVALPGAIWPYCIRGGSTVTYPGISVKQAYNIDVKTDDGIPQSGNVQAQYVSNTAVWYAGAATGGYPNFFPSTAATAPAATTCYDNASTAGATQQYSMAKNGGNGVNCALSFRFQ